MRESAECKTCPYVLAQKRMEEHEDAFIHVSRKLAEYSSLMECVVDAMEEVNFIQDDKNIRMANKMMNLIYLLNEDMNELNDLMESL